MTTERPATAHVVAAGPPRLGDRLRDRRDRDVARLFVEHHRGLVTLARGLLDQREEAEEVVQEGFAKLYASFRRLDDPDRALPYLRRTVLNLSRSRLRRRRTRRSKHHLLRDEPVGADPVADDPNLGVERVAAIRAAVAALPRRQQQCVVLRYDLELSDADIAATLGISAGSVKQHLSRARATLAERLEDQR